jgi:hypothetical protein
VQLTSNSLCYHNSDISNSVNKEVIEHFDTFCTNGYNQYEISTDYYLQFIACQFTILWMVCDSITILNQLDKFYSIKIRFRQQDKFVTSRYIQNNKTPIEWEVM